MLTSCGASHRQSPVATLAYINLRVSGSTISTHSYTLAEVRSDRGGICGCTNMSLMVWVPCEWLEGSSGCVW